MNFLSLSSVASFGCVVWTTSKKKKKSWFKRERVLLLFCLLSPFSLVSLIQRPASPQPHLVRAVPFPAKSPRIPSRHSSIFIPFPSLFSSGPLAKSSGYDPSSLACSKDVHIRVKIPSPPPPSKPPNHYHPPLPSIFLLTYAS